MSASVASRCETGRPIVRDARGFSVHRLRRATIRTTVSRVAPLLMANGSSAVGRGPFLVFGSGWPAASRPFVTYRRTLPFRASRTPSSPIGLGDGDGSPLRFEQGGLV